jgi:hypothetical protein
MSAMYSEALNAASLSLVTPLAIAIVCEWPSDVERVSVLLHITMLAEGSCRDEHEGFASPSLSVSPEDAREDAVASVAD